MAKRVLFFQSSCCSCKKHRSLRPSISFLCCFLEQMSKPFLLTNIPIISCRNRSYNKYTHFPSKLIVRREFIYYFVSEPYQREVYSFAFRDCSWWQILISSLPGSLSKTNIPVRFLSKSLSRKNTFIVWDRIWKQMNLVLRFWVIPNERYTHSLTFRLFENVSLFRVEIIIKTSILIFYQGCFCASINLPFPYQYIYYSTMWPTIDY